VLRLSITPGKTFKLWNDDNLDLRYNCTPFWRDLGNSEFERKLNSPIFQFQTWVKRHDDRSWLSDWIIETATRVVIKLLLIVMYIKIFDNRPRKDRNNTIGIYRNGIYVWIKLHLRTNLLQLLIYASFRISRLSPMYIDLSLDYYPNCYEQIHFQYFVIKPSNVAWISI
jgi:hypothetical protein